MLEMLWQVCFRDWDGGLSVESSGIGKFVGGAGVLD